MRLKGSEMVFPEGTEFFSKEGDVPLFRTPDRKVFNAFGGQVGPYADGIDPTKTSRISRAAFDNIVDETFGEGFDRNDDVTDAFARR